MAQHERPRSAWKFVAESKAAAALIGAALDLDPETTVTRSELVGTTEVPLKRLHLEDPFSDLQEAGVFEPVETGVDQETTYRINVDSEVLAAAQRFEQAFVEQMDGE